MRRSAAGAATRGITSHASSVQLDGRVALVTGAGKRVGRAIALALGQQGMRLAVHHNRSVREAEETREALTALGVDARLVRADLRQPDAPAILVEEVFAEFGALDVVVNSAATMMRTPIGDVTPAQWDEIFALNLRAPFFIAQAAAKRMGEVGAIINLADLAAFETWPGYLPHGISKSGVVHLTKALARVLAPRIRVNAVAPGVVLLPEGWDEAAAQHLVSTTPLKRIGDPDDVVNAVLYLLRADFVTGETLLVDGGRHVRK